MKVVYIAGPFRGRTAWDIEQNIRRAEDLGYLVAQVGASPLIPHANTRYFHGSMSDAFWLDATLELLRRCDAIVLCKGYQDSIGSLAEIAEATRLIIPVFAGPSTLISTSMPFYGTINEWDLFHKWVKS